MSGPSADAQIAGIASLADASRRELYAYVVAQDDAVSREAAAAGVGVPVHVAKFHLDRLEADGLLVSEYRRPEGRRGPGAGRPAKHYRRAPTDFAVSLPEREYLLAGRVLADAVARTARGEAALADALRDAAYAAGQALVPAGSPRRGDALERVRDALAPHGFEPRIARRCLTLANCPFHALAAEHPALVCGINTDLIRGVIDQLGTKATAALDPAEGRCCVTVTAKG